MDPRQQVKAGYDRIAEQYLAAKKADDPVMLAALESLADGVPTGSALDLGCGAGIPVTRWLAQQFATTGVDVSARQLELAREHVPDATFVQSDMTQLAFPSGSFDIVVAFYAIIHVPREEQLALVSRIHGWLKPSGKFLATWAIDAWEGADEDWEGWGAPMWWSHYDADANLAMLRNSGFHIESAQRHTQGDETWLWVRAHA